MRNNPDLSIVIPFYNEYESLPELYDWIKQVMRKQNITYEIVFVDDGSTDQSWKAVERLISSQPNIKAIRFRRNHGKSAALHVGFKEATGQVVITMDADLQDSPDEIPALYKMIKFEGYDLVSGWKKRRHDPLGKTLPSKLFNRTARMVSGIKLHDFNCGLKAYKSKVIKNIEIYGEMHRYIPIIANEAGFHNITEKIVEHHARKYGVSKFGIERMMKGFLDLLSLKFITRFSKRPMHLFGGLGSGMFFIGGASAIYLIVDKLIKQADGLSVRQVADQPAFFLALLFIVLGVQLFLAGFLGELISRNSSSRNEYQVDVIKTSYPDNRNNQPQNQGNRSNQPNQQQARPFQPKQDSRSDQSSKNESNRPNQPRPEQNRPEQAARPEQAVKAEQAKPNQAKTETAAPEENKPEQTARPVQKPRQGRPNQPKRAPQKAESEVTAEKTENTEQAVPETGEIKRKKYNRKPRRKAPGGADSTPNQA